jgi:CYTH domain-containing protein
MSIEREIRFLVTDGDPPDGGERIEQAYLLRAPPVRVRLRDGRRAALTLKAKAGALARFEWEREIPVPWARRAVALGFPRVEKRRVRDGDLEIDVFSWPRPLVIVECELEASDAAVLDDPARRSAWMEARRPPWVRAWRDVTDERGWSNAALARRRRRTSR